MFSVIIPLYNKEKYIQKAIQSVLDQKYTDFELIVVDDGSTDESLNCLKIFSDKRIKVIKQQNAGVSTARNNGVKEAKYDLVAFLDADDWWHQDFLSEMLLLIEDFKDAAVYSCAYFKVKNGQNIPAKIGVEANFIAGYVNYYEVYSKTFWVPVNCSFVVVRKDAFLSENGFNQNLKFGEDLDLWLRFSLDHKFAFLNKFLAFSNQDVPAQNRALGNKLWPKAENVFFNLDYLKTAEKENATLKFLLEGLKMRAFHDYYRNANYRKEIKEIVKEFDFSKHNFLYTFYYKYPFWLTQLFFRMKVLGSIFKQLLKPKSI
ncbi:MAG: glycosyltransferase family 2 protein [Flavobacteriia bacterium]|jgi:glycosyltransferase involved in cell wall biosynthesis